MSRPSPAERALVLEAVRARALRSKPEGHCRVWETRGEWLLIACPHCAWSDVVTDDWTRTYSVELMARQEAHSAAQHEARCKREHCSRRGRLAA